MRYISLCTGVGGLDRALDALGGECLVQVEIEPYCRSILALRWPDVPRHDDLRTFHYWSDPLTEALRGLPVDLVAGGIPCQPASHAGRRKGKDDPRWLWPDALRVVREAQPARVFFENPIGLRTIGLDDILAELSDMDYGGAWEIVAAADVGAPHLRKRIFIMGIRGRSGWDGPTRPPGNRAVTWPTPSLPGGGRTIPDGADWRGRTTAYHDGKKLQVGLDSAVREWPEDCQPVTEVFGRPVTGAFSHRFRTSAKIGDPCMCGATTKDVDEDVAVSRTPILWPTPTASGERPNEGNVRLLRARVLAGDMTEQEAAGMLNGKSVFAAQGKVPALWPTPSASARSGSRIGTNAHPGVGLEEAVRKVPAMPMPTARLGDQRGPQAKRYFDPARSNDLDDYVAAWPTPSAGDNRDRGHVGMPAIDRRIAKGKQLNLSMTVSTERGALSPDWTEWLMGWPIGWTDINCTEPGPVYGWESEPAIPRIGLGIPNRSKRLTAIGNGVVTAQAAFAWNRLIERLEA